LLASKSTPSFDLPSFSQTAILYDTGEPVCAGTGRLFSIDSAETTGMPKGTVKWFNPTKGYGFIQPATGGKDIFVHISAVQKAGLQTLNEGQSVEYEEIANRGKTSAENLKV
jgi:cold shock protein